MQLALYPLTARILDVTLQHQEHEDEQGVDFEECVAQQSPEEQLTTAPVYTCRFARVMAVFSPGAAIEAKMDCTAPSTVCD